MEPDPLLLVLQPHQQDSERVVDLVRRAVMIDFPNAAVTTIEHLQDIYRPYPEAVIDAISKATLIIGNMDGGNQSVTLGLGAALSMKKPILLIAPAGRALSVPEDLYAYRLFVFSLAEPDVFVDSLRHQIGLALQQPQAGVVEPTARNVFVSYNHNDSEYLQRLLVHLRPLDRARLIDTWVDTRLRAGDQWEREITMALQRAHAAILLVSADYMASDFIVTNELPPLLAKAEAEGTRIIPVILKPCRFTRDKHISRFQAVSDPRTPLISLPEGEREAIYDKVAMAVEAVVRAAP
jgi:hypothetical protein